MIEDHTSGLKKTSLAYITEHDRALRILQALFRAGVDPSHIKITAVPTAKGEVNTILVTGSTDAASGTTAKLAPAAATAAPGPQDFTINFTSGLAEPTHFDEAAFHTFLASVGQPNHDAVVIEGYTDTVGNAAYNKALGELRALTVYEMLARAGLPPYRVDTESHGAAHASKGKEAGGGNLADRKVVVRWSTNAKLAAVAAAEEAPKVVPPPAEPPPAAPPPPAVVKAEEPPPPEPAKTDNKGDLDLVAFVGALQPGGALKNNAKSTGTYGLGIGKALWSDATEGRVTLFATGRNHLAPKQKDRAGPLNINVTNLRFDYVLGSVDALVRPFAGIGAGYYLWNGSIRQPSTLLRNTGDKHDYGTVLALGLEAPLRHDLFLAAEVTWNRVLGDFNDSLYSGWLSLRWRL